MTIKEFRQTLSDAEKEYTLVEGVNGYHYDIRDEQYDDYIITHYEYNSDPAPNMPTHKLIVKKPERYLVAYEYDDKDGYLNSAQMCMNSDDVRELLDDVEREGGKIICITIVRNR